MMKMISADDFHWIREPKKWSRDELGMELYTEPHTDLWQRTYYHFRNDNAPLYLAETDDPFFSFSVKTCFEYKNRFDQAGIVIYQDQDNWFKASIEYENEKMARLGSVVTNSGYSDWATTEIENACSTIWFRLSRREDDFKIEFSWDGLHFSQMRIAHLFKGRGIIRFGLYACSPEDSFFPACFSDLNYGDCVWQAHDGQQPDDPK